MTYHPKSIMPCALFLATKTDNYYLSLSSFAEQIPNSTPEDIIAPEFLLTQGLRYTFDVRHPFRGLEGGVMELLAVAGGDAKPGPHRRKKVKSAEEWKREISSLPLPTSATSTPSPTTRISKSHHSSRELLKSPAQMTDAYFLYTPSQIWFAALYIADKPLAEFYFDYKIGLPSHINDNDDDDSEDDPLSPLRTRIFEKIVSCAELLSSYNSSSDSSAKMKNLKRIGKKLYHCQNPEKVDLVGLNRAQKRDGEMKGDGVVREGGKVAGLGEAVEMPERAVKKRKVEGDGGGMFGGELGAGGGG